MQEEWKDVKGYENYYQVSNIGRVKRLERTVISCNGGTLYFKEIILKTWIAGNGYECIKFRVNGIGKHKLVHRLVSDAFIDNPNKFLEVNHKDEDKHNNNVENLEWCTRMYNMHYGTGRQRAAEKQKRKPVIQIDAEGKTINKYASTLEASNKTGYSRGNISGVCHGYYKQAYGYRWEFA